MIANSRKSASRPAVSRQYEFSRLQDQTLACAYEALIPVVARCFERLQPAHRGAEITPMVDRFPHPSAAGA
jgi:hypothetical protein